MGVREQMEKLGVVAVLAMAWFFASNHCAIASMVGGHEPAAHSCCAKSKPVKSQEPCAEKCCGGMAVPVPVAAALSVPVLAVVAFLADLLPPAVLVVAPEAFSGLSPPGRCGEFFVEFVLGRSQQPVAPPVFVA